MSIEGRSLATIRSAILTLWASGMTSIGLTLDQTVGSWAYELADSLAVDALRIEGNAEALGLEIFLSTATTTTLDRQASIEGLTRQEGEVWQGTATVTGTDGTVDCTGRTLIRQGVVYAMGTGASAVVVSGGCGLRSRRFESARTRPNSTRASTRPKRSASRRGAPSCSARTTCW